MIFSLERLWYQIHLTSSRLAVDDGISKLYGRTGMKHFISAWQTEKNTAVRQKCLLISRSIKIFLRIIEFHWSEFWSYNIGDISLMNFRLTSFLKKKKSWFQDPGVCFNMNTGTWYSLQLPLYQTLKYCILGLPDHVLVRIYPYSTYWLWVVDDGNITRCENFQVTQKECSARWRKIITKMHALTNKHRLYVYIVQINNKN